MSDALNSSTLNCLYFGMLAGGLIFALGTLLLSGSHGDADAGAADADADAGDGGDLRIFSPITLATFMAVFGATGLVASVGFDASARTSLLIAGLVAVGVSLLVAYIYGRVLAALHSSTDLRQADMLGVNAEVITPIPANGLGEVMFVVNDERITRPARSSDDAPISRGVGVVIERVSGAHVVVQRRAAPPSVDAS